MKSKGEKDISGMNSEHHAIAEVVVSKMKRFTSKQSAQRKLTGDS